MRKKKELGEKKIQNMIFMNRVESLLFFRVVFDDGFHQVMNNRELKLQYPFDLIDFYENNLIVAPNGI